MSGRKKTERKVMQEWILEVGMLFFELFVRDLPEEKRSEFRKAFDEAQQTFSKLLQQSGAHGWPDVEKKLPDNLWVKTLADARKRYKEQHLVLESRDSRASRKEFRSRVQKRMRGDNPN